uniref:LisH domain-containing protein n=1 Tax=Angiostrongylus cantonensis TaxID=6313 RepID=A0A0K0D7Q9_ANGCA
MGTVTQPTEVQEEKDKSLVARENDATPERPLDIERLRRCIIEFVHENFLEVVFWQMQTANKDFDEMLGVQAVVLLSKMDEVSFLAKVQLALLVPDCAGFAITIILVR